MSRESNPSKLHGKKRSYFLKAKKSTPSNGEVDRLQITASKREKDGSRKRNTINLFLKDLPDFLGTLQECIRPKNNAEGRHG